MDLQAKSGQDWWMSLLGLAHLLDSYSPEKIPFMLQSPDGSYTRRVWRCAYWALWKVQGTLRLSFP